MNKNLLLLSLCLLLSFQTKLFAQTDTIYVNINATGNNTGTSWTDAYTYFGDGLKSAKYGDAVWVAKGIYNSIYEDPFELSTSIKIYGGFNGNETKITDRNWKLNETVLDQNKFGGTPYRGNILSVTNTDTTAILDGFIIQNGYSHIDIPDPLPPNYPDCENNPYNFRACQGGGIFMQSMSVDKPVYLNIYNCIFRNNYAIAGGAIGIDSYLGIGGINLNNCEFYNNKSSEEAGALFMYFGPENHYSTTINNSIFHDNGAYTVVGTISYNSYDPNGIFSIKNSQFIKNSTYLTSCGAIYNFNKNAKGTVIENCLFKENKCGTNKYLPGWGGAFLGFNTSFINCRFSKNKAFVGGAIAGSSNLILNCIFDLNTAYDMGGALFVFDGNNFQNTCSIANSNFYNNQSENIGGGLSNYFNQKLNISNSIFSNNIAKVSANNIFTEESTEVNLSNNMFEESKIDSLVITNDTNINVKIKIDTSTIILDSPTYWDTAIGDFRISNCSKAIDAGDSKWTQAYSLIFDYTNGPRIKDKNPDLGAYEMDKFLSFDTLITNASTSQSKDGSIKLVNIKGFKPPLDYTWSTGTKDASISMLKAGNYLVFIEDSLKCAETFYFNVEALTAVNTVISLTDISISPNTVNRFGTKPVLTFNSDKDQLLSYKLTNNLGQVLRNEQWNISPGKQTKELPNDHTGVYFILLENKEHHKSALKYIVN